MSRIGVASLLVLAVGGLAPAATGCTDGGEPQPVADAGPDGELLADGGGTDAEPDASRDAAADAGGGKCTLDADCDDGLDCTVDSCVDGECVHEPADAFCDDGNECTANTCDTETDCQTTDVADGTECPSGDGECSGGEGHRHRVRQRCRLPGQRVHDRHV